MAKCKRCNRELKNHDESGMGKICKMKANRISASEKIKTIRVEPLFTRRQPRRSYLVFTSPRVRVVVDETETGRFAKCECSENQFCEHIGFVKEVDRFKFPQDLNF